MKKIFSYTLPLTKEESEYIEDEYFLFFPMKDECENSEIENYIKGLLSATLTQQNFKVSPRDFLQIANVNAFLIIINTFGYCLDHRMKDISPMQKISIDICGYTYMQWLNLICPIRDNMNKYIQHLSCYLNTDNAKRREPKDLIDSVSLADDNIKVVFTEKGFEALSSNLVDGQEPDAFIRSAILNLENREYDIALSEDDKDILQGLFFACDKVSPLFIGIQKKVEAIKGKSKQRRFIQNHFNEMAEKVLDVCAVYQSLEDKITSLI